MPNTARATSLRPDPTSPASVTISPARTVKEISVNTPSRVSRSTLEQRPPGGAVRSGGPFGQFPADHRADQVTRDQARPAPG